MSMLSPYSADYLESEVSTIFVAMISCFLLFISRYSIYAWNGTYFGTFYSPNRYSNVKQVSFDAFPTSSSVSVFEFGSSFTLLWRIKLSFTSLAIMLSAMMLSSPDCKLPKLILNTEPLVISASFPIYFKPIGSS